MRELISRIKRPLKNERGDIPVFACFFVTGVIMLVTFLLLFFSVQINCINIRNGIKMELNNLSAPIYADTYRSQRESNFSEYLNTLYQSSSYKSQLDLLYHLVGCMVELLFCADDAENIQDESQQDDRDEDEQKRAQIIGVAGLGM